MDVRNRNGCGGRHMERGGNQPAYADSQIWQPGLRTVAAEGLLASSSLRDKILRTVFHLKVKETINYDIGKLSGLSILTLGNDWKNN